MPLITDTGFGPDPEDDGVVFDTLPDTGKALTVALSNDADAREIMGSFERIALIEIPFPDFGDGRGFSLARRLRDLGYRGRLRAKGHVIVDQYAYARACGFDEVLINDALAARQDEAQWLRAAHSLAQTPYREKLRAA